MISDAAKVDVINALTMSETLRLVGRATALSGQTGAALAVDRMAQAAMGAAVALARSAAASGVGEFSDASLRAALERLLKLEQRVLVLQEDGAFSSSHPTH